MRREIEPKFAPTAREDATGAIRARLEATEEEIAGFKKLKPSVAALYEDRIEAALAERVTHRTNRKASRGQDLLLRASRGTGIHQFSSGLPFFSMYAMRSWVAFSAQSSTKPSRSSSRIVSGETGLA